MLKLKPKPIQTYYYPHIIIAALTLGNFFHTISTQHCSFDNGNGHAIVIVRLSVFKIHSVIEKVVDGLGPKFLRSTNYGPV